MNVTIDDGILVILTIIIVVYKSWYLDCIVMGKKK